MIAFPLEIRCCYYSRPRLRKLFFEELKQEYRLVACQIPYNICRSRLSLGKLSIHRT